MSRGGVSYEEGATLAGVGVALVFVQIPMGRSYLGTGQITEAVDETGAWLLAEGAADRIAIDRRS